MKKYFASFWKRPLLRDTVLLFVALSVLTSAFHEFEPVFSEVRYRITEADDWQTMDFPFAMDTPEDVYPEISFIMSLGSIRPSRYVIVPDDCVEEMTINEVKLPDDLFPICDYWFGEVRDLSPYLNRGENLFHVKIKNDGGFSKVKMFSAHRNTALIFLRTLLVLTAGLYLWRLARVLCKKKSDYVLCGAFSLSIFIRLYYFFITRYEVRGHDSEGHYEYIQYLLDNSFKLPISTEGWEFYHPPLYYYFSAIWVKADMLFVEMRHVLLRDMQALAFYLSIGMLVLILWISFQLFPKPKQSLERTFFFLLVTLLPSFVYFCARINNDVLYQLFAFAILALTFAWWKEPRMKYWFLNIVMVVLAILTKSTVLLLLPVVYACLLLHRKVKWKRKLILGMSGILIIACSTGWFYALRFVEEENDSIVQNISHLSSGLSVDGSIQTLAEFNPVRVVLGPFNDSWSGERGRDYFWEYWMRSAFFGEYIYRDTARFVGASILFIAIMLLPFFFLGVLSCIRNRRYETFPIWFTSLVLILGHLAYRQYAPFSPSQDFRYSLLLIVPFSYFLIIGINERSKWMRRVCYASVSLLVFLYVVFIFGLPLFE